MKIARSQSRGYLKTSFVKRETLIQEEFIKGVTTKFRCALFTPTDRLADAFDKYKIDEIYTDKKAKHILEKPESESIFIKNLQTGLGLEDNLADVFSDHDLIISQHQDKVVCIMASQENITRAREIDLIEVAEGETERSFSRPERSSLDEIEHGNMLSGPNQTLLIQILEKKEPFTKE